MSSILLEYVPLGVGAKVKDNFFSVWAEVGNRCIKSLFPKTNKKIFKTSIANLNDDVITSVQDLFRT